MTGGSFVFLHPAVKDSELSCDFSPPGEYLREGFIWIKPSRLILLFITNSFKPKLSSDNQEYTN